MTNDVSSAVGAMVLVLTCVLTFGLLCNLEGFCKMLTAISTNREVAKLRRQRLALLFERRMDRNEARAAREGGAALYVESGGNND